MKVNYIVDENNIIRGYTIVPFNPVLPTIEVEQESDIHVGFSQVINGKFVGNDINFKDAKDKQLARNILYNEINGLKQKLQATDYEAIKFAEGEISAEDFAPIKEQRKAWRVRINELENELEESN